MLGIARFSHEGGGGRGGGRAAAAACRACKQIGVDTDSDGDRAIPTRTQRYIAGFDAFLAGRVHLLFLSREPLASTGINT